MSLNIVKAKYFTDKNSNDVLDIVRRKVNRKKLEIEATNANFTDPDIGTPKKLMVGYIFEGTYYEVYANEGETLIVDGPSNVLVLDQVAKEANKEATTNKEPHKYKIRTDIVKSKRKITKKDRFVDIIIPTYENDFLTAACFESIKRNTLEGTYRIIWVDNGSKNMELSKAAIKNIKHVKKSYKKNRGFVAAINAGIKKSTAPLVCLLNNDTQVYPRWLEKLTDAIYSEDKLGIVGPLTGPGHGKGGCDSHHSLELHKDLVENPEFKSYEQINLELEAAYKGVTVEPAFVAFLCALIKREVIDKIGLLDTRYDMGMYDDNDYNIAVRKAGYDVALTLDTCIFHKGRTTFKKIQSEEGFDIDSLLKNNFKKMKEKWGLV